jgi:hypothetical protein
LSISVARHAFAGVALALCLSIVPVPAAAQSAPARKDSTWNGALIGAGLGAIGGFLLGAVIVECSECAGFNVRLTFGVVGAGAGAAIGAGIDARVHQRSRVWAPPPRRRVRIAPVAGRKVTGVFASIRF